MGRSLAWAAKGNTAKADADRTAALRADPLIEDIFAGDGITRETIMKR